MLKWAMGEGVNNGSPMDKSLHSLEKPITLISPASGTEVQTLVTPPPQRRCLPQCLFTPLAAKALESPYKANKPG